MLGEFYDATYGTTRGEILAQFTTPSAFTVPAGAEPDSMSLTLVFNTWKGSKYSPVQIAAYEMDKGTLNYNTTYYTTEDAANYSTKSKLLGSRISVAVPDTVTDTASYQPHLKYKFSKQRTIDFFQAAKSGVFKNQSSFANFFNGVYLRSEYGDGSIWNISHLYMTLYYHYHALKPLKRELQLFQLDTKLDSDAAIIVYVLIEILRIFFLLEPNALTKATNLLNNRKEAVEAVFLFVGKVDVLCSMVALRKELPYYCRPESAEPKIIETTEIYHPLIPDCISNDFSNGHKSIILTGSNMSGKTAFIRTIAINMLTAQTLNLCFAKTFRAQPMQLFSSIHINDDLMNAKSYYLQEVLTVKEMMDASGKEYPSLFLLDELFKGTNTTERIAAGKAILSALNSGNNIVLVATHDLELAELLRDEFDLYHFSEQIQQEELTFDYKLKKGIMPTKDYHIEHYLWK